MVKLWNQARICWFLLSSTFRCFFYARMNSNIFFFIPHFAVRLLMDYWMVRIWSRTTVRTRKAIGFVQRRTLSYSDLDCIFRKSPSLDRLSGTSHRRSNRRMADPAIDSSIVCWCVHYWMAMAVMCDYDCCWMRCYLHRFVMIMCYCCRSDTMTMMRSTMTTAAVRMIVSVYRRWSMSQCHSNESCDRSSSSSVSCRDHVRVRTIDSGWESNRQWWWMQLTRVMRAHSVMSCIHCWWWSCPDRDLDDYSNMTMLTTLSCRKTTRDNLNDKFQSMNSSNLLSMVSDNCSLSVAMILQAFLI